MATSADATLRVFRFQPGQDEKPRFDTYHVQAKSGMTVLDALFQVLDDQDGSLAFRYSCRGAICGSCAMYINGSYRLACQTQLANLGAGPVSVNPLPHLPIIKDLAVDMAPFFDKYEKVMPYLLGEERPPEKEFQQSIDQRKKIDEAIDCILCGCCYSSCPSVWTNKSYLGPAALTKAYRFVADSRDKAYDERLAIVSGEEGVWRCHTIFNCVEACPKKINCTYSIQELKKKTLTRRLKFW
ncbi:MAG: succinate dehydrogenase iron-sulfur subunit [Dehalococcoidia bacterium]|nr:succinate dehydrogenase iron-sulfur subunit [Dehalococcoidia bacterium]